VGNAPFRFPGMPAVRAAWTSEKRAIMSVKSRALVLGLALLSAAGALSQARAQDSTVGGAPSFSHSVGPLGPPRIQINPRPLFRRCTSWYVVQYRPSGRVLFPEKHCWWVRG
jgi:hypothetical protein